MHSQRLLALVFSMVCLTGACANSEDLADGPLGQGAQNAGGTGGSVSSGGTANGGSDAGGIGASSGSNAGGSGAGGSGAGGSGAGGSSGAPTGMDPALGLPDSGSACSNIGGSCEALDGPGVCRIYSQTEGRCESCTECGNLDAFCTASSECDILFQCYQGGCTNLCDRSVGCSGVLEWCIDVGNDMYGVCMYPK